MALHEQLGLLAALERDRLTAVVIRVSVVELARVASAPKSARNDLTVEEVGGRVAVGVAKSVAVITTKAVLQRAAVETLGPEEAYEYMIDVPKYAKARSNWKHSNSEVALEVLPVAARAVIFQHLAFFLVYQTVDVASFLFRRREGDRLSEERRRAQLRRSSTRNVAVCVGSIGLGAVGHALGSLIAPGLGTAIVGTVFESVLYLV